jgi:cysteine synthase A
LTRRLSKDLFIGLLVGITLSLSSTSAALYLQQYRRKKAIQRMPPGPIELRSEEIGDGVIGLIGESSIYSRGTHRGKGGADLAGNTPLIRINSLSDALGVEILVSSQGSSMELY